MVTSITRTRTSRSRNINYRRKREKEVNMKARRKKKRIRKSTRYSCIIIAIVLIFASFSSLLKNISDGNMKTKTKQIYSYTNHFNYDYDVNMTKNKYVEDIKKSEKNIAYVTDLISYTDLELNYTYQADKNSEIKYNYEVIGKMQAVYTKDGEEQKIIDKEEILLEKQEKEIVANYKPEVEIDLAEKTLKLCQDKIVQVNNKPDGNTENTVIVKDFGEIVKLSEELFKPILYYSDQEKEEAWFSVMSNNVIYRYLLKK